MKTLARLETLRKSPVAWRRWLVLLAAIYVVLPVDAVPDIVPLFGWLDDIAIVLAAIGLNVRGRAPEAWVPANPRVR